jgi:hypothetical protein
MEPQICHKCGGVIPAGWPYARYVVDGAEIVMHRFWTECDKDPCKFEPTAEDVIRLHGMGVDPTV